MKLTTKSILLTLAGVLALSLTTRADDVLPPASTQTGVTYATDIKPIFDASCLKCHDSKGPKQAAHLSLDTLAGILKGDRDGAVIKPGDSAHSDLVMSIAHIGDPDSYMPKRAKKLSDEKIALIRAWIDQGAK
jgi:mono/diheme cytochrome c family protein